jgi:hypothetical protein
MDTFYCIGCRFLYPVEKAARIASDAHLDGQPVGFCFVCARGISPGVEGPELAGDSVIVALDETPTGT